MQHRQTERLEVYRIELWLIIHDIISLYLRKVIHAEECAIHQSAIVLYKHNELEAVAFI